MSEWIFICRAGFEPECAAEVEGSAKKLGVEGKASAVSGSGLARFTAEKEPKGNPWRLFGAKELVFARQSFWVFGEASGMENKNRVQLLASFLDKELKDIGSGFVSQVFCEAADTDEGRSLWPGCNKLSEPLAVELSSKGRLRPLPLHRTVQPGPRLHIYFLNKTDAVLGLSETSGSSPWPMGIPRLRFPTSAPSRSTLKLDEAILFFLTEAEQSRRLKAGMRAVDLGAAPGGWSWQLARRGLLVEAVDNGPMDRELLSGGLVEHIKADGFTYRPQKAASWMVCDMVAQPSRVANLIASWASKGLCRESIFNLKLPMKKRLLELSKCAAIIERRLKDAGISHTLRFKQLYHDREEVTGHLRLEEGASKGRTRPRSKQRSVSDRNTPGGSRQNNRR